MNTTLVFEKEKVTDRITRIRAFCGELLYLVEGEDRAALIDTGSGIGSLKGYLEKLTKKKLLVLLTHGHIDHAMGAAEFEDVYMNKEDTYIFRQHSDPSYRVECLELVQEQFCAGPEDLIPAIDLERVQDLKEGDRFDLGGISIEIYACPGHTRGSVVMLIPEERMLMTGDACNAFTFLFDDYSTSIAEYEQSLRKLCQKLDGKYDNILLSHGSGYGYKGLLEDVIQVCEDIRHGNVDDVPFSFQGAHGWIAKAYDPDTGPAKGNIVYSKNRVESV